MTRVRVDGTPMRGYGKWLSAEHNESVGRTMTMWCIYDVPDDVAAEMIAKGAKVDIVSK